MEKVSKKFNGRTKIIFSSAAAGKWANFKFSLLKSIAYKCTIYCQCKETVIKRVKRLQMGSFVCTYWKREDGLIP